MKEVKAYIKTHKLEEVTHALHKIEGLTGMSFLERSGVGINWATEDVPTDNDSRSGVKIELVCNDEFVDEVVSIIKTNAHTGLKGDGQIFVSPIEKSVRIGGDLS